MPISRIVKFLLITVLVKLCILAVLTIQPPVPALLQFQSPVAGQNQAVIQEPGMDMETEPAQAAASSSLIAAALAADGEEPIVQDQESNEPFSMQREALLRKQEELERKEQSLLALEQEVDEKLARLQELEANLTRLLEQANELRDDKMKHLIDVYTNMKAQQAAAVLETLDETIAVMILAGMRGRQAGEILTYVNPEKAARLSEALTQMQVNF